MSQVIISTLKILTAFTFIWFLLFFSNNKIYINYDSIPYAASSYLLKNNNEELAHKYTWDLLKTKV